MEGTGRARGRSRGRGRGEEAAEQARRPVLASAAPASAVAPPSRVSLDKVYLLERIIKAWVFPIKAWGAVAQPGALPGGRAMRQDAQAPPSLSATSGRAAVTHEQVVAPAEQSTGRAFRGTSAPQATAEVAANRFMGRGASRGRENRELIITRPSPDFVKMGM